MDIFRINDYSIVRLAKTTESITFYEVQDSVSQFILADENDWNNTIWMTGAYLRRLNKVYNNECLIPFKQKGWSVDYQVKNIEILLRQGFTFENLFGFLVIVTDNSNETIYCAKILYERDFKITTK